MGTTGVSDGGAAESSEGATVDAAVWDCSLAALAIAAGCTRRIIGLSGERHQSQPAKATTAINATSVSRKARRYLSLAVGWLNMLFVSSITFVFVMGASPP